MTFGASIGLGVLGAILRYAVADEVEGADLKMIGGILMLAALAGLILAAVQMTQQRKRVVVDGARPVREVPVREVREVRRVD